MNLPPVHPDFKSPDRGSISGRVAPSPAPAGDGSGLLRKPPLGSPRDAHRAGTRAAGPRRAVSHGPASACPPPPLTAETHGVDGQSQRGSGWQPDKKARGCRKRWASGRPHSLRFERGMIRLIAGIIPAVKWRGAAGYGDFEPRHAERMDAEVPARASMSRTPLRPATRSGFSNHTESEPPS